MRLRAFLVILVVASVPAHATQPYVWTDFSIWQARGAWDSWWYPIDEVDHLGVLDGHLVMTGVFDHVGNRALEPPAVYDGSTWTAPFSFQLGNLSPIVPFAGDLMIGRQRWDGQSVTELVGTLDFRPQVLSAVGSELVGAGHVYAEGFFVCRWDEGSEEWIKLGGRFTDSQGGPPDFFGIAQWQDGVVVVGDALDLVGQVAVQNVARWDGQDWAAMGSPFGNGGDVTSVVVYQGELLVGAYAGIYRWNGSDWESWAPVDGGRRRAKAFVVDGDDLVVGGSFDHVGGVQARGVTRWHDGQWSPLGAGVSGEVLTVAVDGPQVYVGGKFLTAGGKHAFNLARHDGASWHHMGEGGLGLESSFDELAAIREYDGSVVVAGTIERWGTVALANVARREGDGWVGLGPGLNGPVHELVEFGGDLVARGDFTASGATPMQFLARWNGSEWSPMVTSLQGQLLDIAVRGPDLIAAGEFYNIDGVPTAHLARFDGETWSPLTGLSGAAEAVVAYEGDLVAAGRFLFAGGQLVNRVARFDGVQWHDMDGGVGWTATILAVVDGVLYVGGEFTSAGGETASHVASWDGSQWRPMGAGLSDAPEVIEGHLGLVYVGGAFTSVDGQPQRSIAAWDPTAGQWVDPGYEVSGTCFALESKGALLRLGGAFVEIQPDGEPEVSSLRYGEVTTTNPTAVESPAVREGSLLAAVPNPFNPSTVLRFDLPRAGRVRLAVFDARGRRVVTLLDEMRGPGPHEATWSGVDARGLAVSSGVYLAELRFGSDVQSRKLTLVQ